MTSAEGRTARPALRALADEAGILAEYVDQTGQETRRTPDSTREALLAALGYDAGTESGAEQAFREMIRARQARLLSPVRVVRAGELALTGLEIPGANDVLEWRLDLVEEHGESHHAEGGSGTGSSISEYTLPLLAPGYHNLTLHARIGAGNSVAEQTLIVAPDSCYTVPAGQRYTGLTANLYTVRSAGNWGAGDLGDLRELLEWSAEIGADFVGMNPLHALFNRGTEISPYSPVSRIYRNPLYLRVENIPELEHCPEARELIGSRDFAAELGRLRSGAHIQYEELTRLARPVLESLHRTFMTHESERNSQRARAYAAYRHAEGDALDNHATFMALDEVLAEREGRSSWWREWPEELRDPRSPAVSRFRLENAERVDFHRWLQFELERQMEDAAAAGRRKGLAVGLYQDLAIGSSGGGSDVWAFPSLFVHGVSIGAPPDVLGPEGQDWGLPPLDPRRLAEDRYAYWIRVLRSAFRHAGAVRVDHILGLFRQFWIPWGSPSRDGAYVRFPTDDLFGILALESVRHRALVVGEDLGTVPPEVPPALRRWGSLSSKVLLFERTDDGAFKESAAYAPDALATANTHDLPTIEGWLAGADIDLREQLGRITTEQAEEDRAERNEARQMLLRRLEDEGFIDSAASPPSGAALRGAVHRFIRATPSLLAGLSLDDLAGERDPVNVPGANAEEYPSWTRRLRRTLEELRTAPDVQEALGAQAARQI